MKKATISLATAIVFCLFALAVAAAVPDKARVTASYMKLPLSFVKNEGQMKPSVLFYERSGGHATAFTKEGVSLSLMKPGKAAAARSYETVTLTPVGGSAFTVEAMDRKVGRINYLIGNDPSKWKTNIPTYGAILYKNVYPGIDMKFYGSNSELEYDLIVAPGSDPSTIRLSYKGIRKLSLTAGGGLEIALKEGALFQKKPHLYQIIDGKKVEIEGSFILADATTYGFKVGAYDRKHQLVIDPVLVYSTYLGGTGDDDAYSIAVDSSGCAYVTGATSSTNFPGTIGFYQPANAGGVSDAFVAKLSADGKSLVYATYLGGTNQDGANSLALDSQGCAYVTGYTLSTDFPGTTGFYQPANAGGQDAFVAKLSADGASLVYATYLGGTGADDPYGIAVDSQGSAYVTGNTTSTDFPGTTGFFQATNAGDADAFVAKLSADGRSLAYSTYLGGAGDDKAYSVAVDSSGCAYVTGSTGSTGFPTRNAYQPAKTAVIANAFVTKLSADGRSLVYSTYLGGNGGEEALAIAVDSLGNAYLAGYTASTDLPMQNAFQPAHHGDFEVFVSKFSADGMSLLYSTYLGGTGTDYPFAIAVDSQGYAYVTGVTSSTDFPVKNAYQTALAGGMNDAFVAKLDPEASGASSLAYSTYLGGNDTDMGRGIAVDSQGAFYVAGYTASTNFPGTTGFYQPANAGTEDAFIVKFGPDTAALTVTKAGPGLGTVTCNGAACTSTYSYGTSVTLTATPASDSTFTGWSGACTNTTGTCTVAMTEARAVTATFNSCTYTINPTTKSFPYRGGFTNVTVTASGTSCVRPVITVSDSSWITTSMGPFTRNRGILRITTTTNNSVQEKNGTVTVHTSAFDVAQAAGPCALNSITPVRNTATPAGEPGTFAVDATAGCAWNVTSPNWITATASGNGPGTVSYTPAPNTTGRLRNGTITVALTSAPTKKRVFTLRQSACTLAVSPPIRAFSSAGGSDTLNVTSPTGCPWNVTSSATWLTATASGTGTGPVSYTADPNTTGRPRSARLTVSLTDTPTIKRLFTVTERR